MGTRSLSSGRIAITFSATIRNTLSDGSVAEAVLSHAFTQTFTDGINTNQFNRGWAQEDEDLASAATFTVDLTTFSGIDIGAGAANDPLGQSMDALEIVGIAIENSSTSAGNLIVKGGAGVTNGLDLLPDSGVLSPGGQIAVALPNEAGHELSGTSKVVELEASGGDCVYSFYVFARSDIDDSSSSDSSSGSSNSSSSQSSSSNSSSDSSQSNSSSSQSSSST